MTAIVVKEGNGGGDDWKVDAEKLQKGDEIDAETMEKLFKVNRGSVKFQFLVLALRGELEMELERLGRPATLAQVRGNLRVLTDREASSYNQMQARKAVGMLGYRVRRLGQVDVGGFSVEEARQHQRSSERWSKIFQATASAMKKFSLWDDNGKLTAE